MMYRKIAVIDLFASPKELGEGFSSVFDNDQRFFAIKLLIGQN